MPIPPKPYREWTTEDLAELTSDPKAREKREAYIDAVDRLEANNIQRSEIRVKTSAASFLSILSMMLMRWQ